MSRLFLKQLVTSNSVVQIYFCCILMIFQIFSSLEVGLDDTETNTMENRPVHYFLLLHPYL